MGSAPKTMRGPVGALGFVRWPRLRAVIPGQAADGVVDETDDGDDQEGEVHG
jgi:hypothetical protein